jgi:hypothetical protein
MRNPVAALCLIVCGYWGEGLGASFMSTATGCNDVPRPTAVAESIPLKMMLIAAVVVSCAIVATVAPVPLSILTVFIFAGPHNWMEARYFLTRMPARWGSMAPYFTLGLVGSCVLAGMFAALPWMAGSDADLSLLLIALWNSLFVVWIMRLAMLRRQQNPRRDWPLVIPIGCIGIAVNWMAPLAWSLALVYLHPLIALAFLDRELWQKPRAWQKVFRYALPLIPVCLVAMALYCANGPDISGNDVLTWQITHHAGAGIIPGISTHFLVAAHVFLELLHYLIWILAIPLTTPRFSLWRVPDVPLARRSLNWSRLILAVFALGALVMLILWASFAVDYTWTRNVYFTVAILHVLMEIPFLLRSI